MRATSSDWRVTVSSKALPTRVFGVLAVALGVVIVGGLLSEWRDPAGMFFLVVGGLLAAGGVHFLRRAGKPMFEIDPTGVIYHPLDDISWKTERIPWGRVRTVRYGVPTRGGQIRVLRLRRGAGQELVHAGVRLGGGLLVILSRWHTPRSPSRSRRFRRTSCSNCFNNSPNVMGSRLS